MPAPYSLDLRVKAGFARSTLTEWHNQYRRDGTMSAKQGYQQGHSHKIDDWEAFRAFAEQHGEKTQWEMAQLWPTDISEDTIGRGLKRIGFTRKKRAISTPKGHRQNAKPTRVS